MLVVKKSVCCTRVNMTVTAVVASAGVVVLLGEGGVMGVTKVLAATTAIEVMEVIAEMIVMQVIVAIVAIVAIVVIVAMVVMVVMAITRTQEEINVIFLIHMWLGKFCCSTSSHVQYV